MEDRDWEEIEIEDLRIEKKIEKKREWMRWKGIIGIKKIKVEKDKEWILKRIKSWGDRKG